MWLSANVLSRMTLGFVTADVPFCAIVVFPWEAELGAARAADNSDKNNVCLASILIV